MKTPRKDVAYTSDVKTVIKKNKIKMRVIIIQYAGGKSLVSTNKISYLRIMCQRLSVVEKEHKTGMKCVRLTF